METSRTPTMRPLAYLSEAGAGMSKRQDLRASPEEPHRARFSKDVRAGAFPRAFSRAEEIRGYIVAKIGDGHRHAATVFLTAPRQDHSHANRRW